MSRVIKAIALDLDGTLLTEEKKITRKVRDTLEKASELGVEILIATGRSYAALPVDVCELPYIHYMVTSNGAKVYHFPGKELMMETYILPKQVEQLKDLIRELELDAEVFFDGQGYMNKEYHERILSGKTNRDIEYIRNTRKTTEDVCTILEKEIEKIENICFYFNTMEEKERCVQRVRQMDDLTIASVFELNLEIGSKYADKMKGIRYVLDYLHISSEELLAIGDGENDIDMLKYAGTGVAMGNARDSLKEVADDVTRTNEEDGVADAIEKYIFVQGENR